MEAIVKDIIESVCCKDKDVILDPPKRSKCLFKTDDGRFIPVRIKDGSFYIDGRVSNFWTWINLETGKEEHGYGCFYKMKKTKGKKL